MVDEREFRERVQQIGRLIAGLDDITDKKARTSARELVQLVMELHGAAVERLLQIVFDQGAAGAEMIEKLGRDRIVSSLFALHGLHPDDLETRVARALQEVAARLRKQEVEVQLVQVQQGVVTVSVKTGAHACGSTAATVRTILEETVYEAAPETTSLAIEGLEAKNGNGFVGLDQLLGVGVSASLAQRKAGG